MLGSIDRPADGSDRALTPVPKVPDEGRVASSAGCPESGRSRTGLPGSPPSSAFSDHRYDEASPAGLGRPRPRWPRSGRSRTHCWIVDRYHHGVLPR